jgi:Protein of unknown function (DUF4235)
MTKILFLPFSILGGILAGLIAKKLFDGAWRLVDEEEAPEPEHREVSWAKLLAALAIEGAIFRAVRGLVDRSSRRTFFRLTGSWPGEERPDTSG